MAGPRKLIAGNWKMNILAAEGQALADAVGNYAASAGPLDCDLLVCPPATILHAVAEQLSDSPVAVGGQNCHADSEPVQSYGNVLRAAVRAEHMLCRFSH